MGSRTVTTAPRRMRGVLWDTMWASRLQPQHPDFVELALKSRGSRLEPLLAAGVVHEVLFGMHRQGRTNPRLEATAGWWEDQVLGPDGFQLVWPDSRAFAVASRLRALLPASPSTRDRRRSKPERRVAWVRDIELAALGFSRRLPIRTLNLADFVPLREALARLWPEWPGLQLIEA